MQSYECVTFEHYPLRFYDDRKTPKFITTTDLNMCLLERFKKVCRKLLQCLYMDLSQGKCVLRGYRHCLYLCTERNKQLQYNASFDVSKELCECECKNPVWQSALIFI